MKHYTKGIKLEDGFHYECPKCGYSVTYLKEKGVVQKTEGTPGIEHINRFESLGVLPLLAKLGQEPIKAKVMFCEIDVTFSCKLEKNGQGRCDHCCEVCQ